MTIRKPKVIVTRKLPDIIETRMMELFDCELNLADDAFTRDQMLDAVKRAEILVPTVTDRIDRDIINAAGENLKMIASFGTGVDHLDFPATRKKGIIVTNTPDVLTEDTADMTMALILAVPRRLVEGEQLVRDGKWTGWSPTGMLGHRIWGKRLGIIGMGRIGTAVARRAKGFGLSVHYHNRNRVPEEVEKDLEATFWSSLDQMIAHMDILSINCPHTPATYHLLNSRRLGLMKSHAYIVNTSRGEVIDEAALVKSLSQNQIAGAGLDVYEKEPEINPKLIKLSNVVLLPHMGSATIEGRIAMGERVIINIKTWVDGHNPPDRVIDTMF
ncbi:D-glycerate dehydrogenase [Rhodospirillaceae bacterium KN72]|uniref:D-glycerate dehydrogenase n=1 Tax=Pacificispira spongiicola TaxID=2729598 RepID=A0A7Y0E047_9PROT|nr:D-glycerate dehydrogenase [Pacificispira spongiicola]NMM44800.1 D-glycerate dehydrogenase [Pacificispira spongiicola]